VNNTLFFIDCRPAELCQRRHKGLSLTTLTKTKHIALVKHTALQSWCDETGLVYFVTLRNSVSTQNSSNFLLKILGINGIPKLRQSQNEAVK